MHSPHPIDLRDWFAGQALVGILVSPNTPRPEVWPFDQHAASLAEQAYSYADAMLRERLRNRPPGQDAGESPEALQETPGSFSQEALAVEKATGKTPVRRSFPDELDPSDMPPAHPRPRRLRRKHGETGAER